MITGPLTSWEGKNPYLKHSLGRRALSQQVVRWFARFFCLLSAFNGVMTVAAVANFELCAGSSVGVLRIFVVPWQAPELECLNFVKLPAHARSIMEARMRAWVNVWRPHARLTFRMSRVQFGVNFLCTFLPPERLLGNTEQCEHLTLQVGKGNVEQLHGSAVLGQPVPLGKAEQA